MAEYLAHHGVKGQKWGVRRYQNYDGTRIRASKEVLKKYKKEHKVPRNAQAQNLDSWGEKPETNVLYISGGSGSGKSTIANNLKDTNVEVIHLDSYFDNINGPKNDDFNLFLENKKSDYKNIQLPKEKISINDWGKVVERFEQDIEEYGKDAYKRDKKVIVEGVQLLDDTVRPDKTYFNDKPFIMLNTNALVSTLRANKRDEKQFSINDVTNRMAWNKDIKNVKKQNHFHHSEQEVDDMNKAESLCHSSGPWKKHKFTDKIVKNGKTIYKYAKDKTGVSAKEKLDDANTRYERTKRINNDFYEADEEWVNSEKYKKMSAKDQARDRKSEQRFHNYLDSELRAKRDTVHAAKQVYDKTPLGKVEGTVKKGQKLIDDLLHPKETVTISSNLYKPGTKKTFTKKTKVS